MTSMNNMHKTAEKILNHVKWIANSLKDRSFEVSLYFFVSLEIHTNTKNGIFIRFERDKWLQWRICATIIHKEKQTQFYTIHHPYDRISGFDPPYNLAPEDSEWQGTTERNMPTQPSSTQLREIYRLLKRNTPLPMTFMKCFP